MESVVLKDYQFILLVLICVLLILAVFYGIKRKYDSIDKHISKRTKENYKECMTQYETLSSELDIKTNHVDINNLITFVKSIFKK